MEFFVNFSVEDENLTADLAYVVPPQIFAQGDFVGFEIGEKHVGGRRITIVIYSDIRITIDIP